jgi:dCMP deaminase
MSTTTLEAATPYVRPSWDEYFMAIARVVGTRSTCDRGRTGCVITRDHHMLVTGYSGSPRGVPHCDEVGHQMKTVIHEDGHQTQHCVRTAHAEQNAIVQAAKVGISLAGATLYCKMTPCAVCTKMIINTGVVRVVCDKRYHAGEESERMLADIGIELIFLQNDTEQYAQQK